MRIKSLKKYMKIRKNPKYFIGLYTAMQQIKYRKDIEKTIEKLDQMENLI